jgi:hypothetical protein
MHHLSHAGSALFRLWQIFPTSRQKESLLLEGVQPEKAGCQL